MYKRIIIIIKIINLLNCNSFNSSVEFQPGALAYSPSQDRSANLEPGPGALVS